MEKRNVVLLRVSTDHQDTAYQKDAINRYLKEHNIYVKEDDFIEEDGVSGFKTKLENREGLMKIKGMAINGEIDKLVIFNLDRIGRRMELIGFISFLDECGVKILSVTEGCLNGGNDTDSLLNSVKMWLAEYESKKKSEYIKNGKRRSAMEGKVFTGKPTFGYNVIDKKLVVNEEEAKIIQKVFELYIKHGTSRTIDILNEAKIKRREELWNKMSIKRIIKNTIYIGNQTYKEELLPHNENLRIIEDDMFYKAQNVRNDRMAKNHDGEKITDGTGTRFRNRSQEAILEGVLYHKCKDDKIRKIYIDYSYSNKSKSMYYKCHHCKEHKYKDYQKSYGAKKLHSMLDPTISNLLKNLSVKDLETEYNKEKNDTIKDIELKLFFINKDLNKKEKGLNNATKEFEKIFIGESNLNIDTVNEIIEKLKVEIVQYTKEIERLTTRKIEMEKSSIENAHIIDKLKDFSLLYDISDNLEKKIIIQEFIDKIIIDRNNIEIKIKLC